MAEHWPSDEYFCHELFNGVNPFTIRVVNDVRTDIHPEFLHLNDENGNKLDLSAIPHGDLFVSKYKELRNFAYPNSKLAI